LISKFVLALCPISMLAACGLSPEYYETAPVSVATSAGTVVCQLYTPQIVVWDRSIDRPAKMGVEDADQICKREGLRRRDELRHE